MNIDEVNDFFNKKALKIKFQFSTEPLYSAVKEENLGRYKAIPLVNRSKILNLKIISKSDKFNDLLDLKSSFKHYYKYIYIVYIQLLLHDLYLNKDAEIKPHLIKGGYNSYYNYNSIEFVPNTYYDVLKTESLYKYSTI